VRVIYQDHTLRVETAQDDQSKYLECVSLQNTYLPMNNYFGFTAATGDLGDNHDLYGLVTRNLNSNAAAIDIRKTAPVPEKLKYSTSAYISKILFALNQRNASTPVCPTVQPQQQRAKQKFNIGKNSILSIPALDIFKTKCENSKTLLGDIKNKFNELSSESQNALKELKSNEDMAIQANVEIASSKTTISTSIFASNNLMSTTQKLIPLADRPLIVTSRRVELANLLFWLIVVVSVLIAIPVGVIIAALIIWKMQHSEKFQKFFIPRRRTHLFD